MSCPEHNLGPKSEIFNTTNCPDGGSGSPLFQGNTINTKGAEGTGHRIQIRERRTAGICQKKCPSILFVVIYKFARPFVLCIVLCYLRQKYAREVCGWIGIAFHSAMGVCVGVGVFIKTRV